ncbi:hypothetical protein ACHAWU_003583 [Discostella pseudostelligera]|uniref:Translation initiation factor eIF2B subunit gamma n=1 Tax=Discostella pseudostelligera TaxID=259834 RepID=A0ABD3N4V6_9STRA
MSSSRSLHQAASSSSSPCCDPEYIAIILAATQGARLFPLTSEYPNGVPKHLLPISPLNPTPSNASTAGAGASATLLQRLLVRTYDSGFEMVVIAIHKEDNATIPFLLGTTIDETCNTKSESSGLCQKFSKDHTTTSCVTIVTGDEGLVVDMEYHGLNTPPPASKKVTISKASTSSAKNRRCMHVRVVRLPEDCQGSADALRFLSLGNNQSIRQDHKPPSPNKSTQTTTTPEGEHNTNNFCYIPRTSNAVIIPGDLIMESDLLSHADSTTTTSSMSGSFDGKDVLSLLIQAHRRWNAGGPHNNSTASACTMLLTDVGAEDKEGIPLKESSKAKMGLISRGEEDMEYIGLTSEVAPSLSHSLASVSFSKISTTSASPSRRIVLKRSKLDVEEDEGTGSTPKLTIPKRQLHSSGGGERRQSGRKNGSALSQISGGLALSSTATMDHSPTLSIRTDLLDVHLYVISNWVFELIHARPAMQSFQGEVLPLLISRQFRGVEAAFGPTAWKSESNRERLRKVLKELDGVSEEGGGGDVCHKISYLLGMYASGKMSGGLGRFIPNDDDDMKLDDNNNMDPTTPNTDVAGPSFPTSKHPFVVSAQVLSREASSLTLRACTLPWLLYGCSEITSRTLKLDPAVSADFVPGGTRLSTKFNTILMPGCTMGEKVQTKACMIGKNVVLGDRAKLNNVVVMDGATIGPNTVLQQSVVGVNANIGGNCNLKDCQVGPGAVVPSGTKTTEKGEAFHV